MHKRTIVTLALLVAPLLVTAAGPNPWTHDFEKDELLQNTITCDAGKSVQKYYEATTDKTTFGGITIAVSGVILYYVYTPNPNSMSPVVFIWKRESSGELVRVSAFVRDEDVRSRAPQLYAAYKNEPNDCMRLEKGAKAPVKQ